MQKMIVDTTAPVHVVDVKVELAEGVWATDQDREDIRSKILAQLATLPQAAPAQAVPAQTGPTQPGTPQPGTPNATALSYKMVVKLTRFKQGSAAARMIMIGLGQIHIDGEVTLTDGDGKVAGQYKITKTMAAGGLVGGMTSTSDVENGFAKSVVAAINHHA
ncbi:DUF4410 domain-containing protein [Novosphingobium nitrogenifigens]|nr:DUF4410 domain-containing protein [Novosphingobium nitrogenifigens]